MKVKGEGGISNKKEIRASKSISQYMQPPKSHDTQSAGTNNARLASIANNATQRNAMQPKRKLQTICHRDPPRKNL